MYHHEEHEVHEGFKNYLTKGIFISFFVFFVPFVVNLFFVLGQSA
jgi:hypothetical protein